MKITDSDSSGERFPWASITLHLVVLGGLAVALWWVLR